MTTTATVPTLIKLQDVLRATSLSKSTLRRAINSGSFPAPVKISPRRVGWPAEDVSAWAAGLSTKVNKIQMNTSTETPASLGGLGAPASIIQPIRIERRAYANTSFSTLPQGRKGNIMAIRKKPKDADCFYIWHFMTAVKDLENSVPITLQEMRQSQGARNNARSEIENARMVLDQFERELARIEGNKKPNACGAGFEEASI